MNRTLPWLLVLLLASGDRDCSGADYPGPQESAVNDFADVLTTADEDQVATEALAMVRENGVEFTLVTLRSLARQNAGGMAVEDYARELFNRWGVGHKVTNSGIMLLVLMDDRKLRIQLGSSYGPYADSVAAGIISDVIVPQFKAGHPAAGLLEGVHAIRMRLPGLAGSRRSGTGTGTVEGMYSPGEVIGVFLGMLLLLVAFIDYVNRPEDGWGRVVFQIIGWIITTLVQVLLFVLAVMASGPRHRHRCRGSSWWGPSSSSSSYSSGSSWGSSSSSSSSSGLFGGGSSSGGGASGSW